MNTTVVSIPTTEGASDPVRADYDIRALDYVSIPVLLIVGAVGNTLTIGVMFLPECRLRSISRFLIALSFSDLTVNLMSPFNEPAFHRLTGRDLRALTAVGCRFFQWLYRLGKFSSSWLVVLISVERFIAVWLPHRAKRLNTMRNAYISIGSMYGTFSVYLAFHVHWLYGVSDGLCTSRDGGGHRAARLHTTLSTISFCIYELIPTISLTVLTALIVFKLCLLKRRRLRQVAQVTSVSKFDSFMRTTTMLIGISLAFVVLELPSIVRHLMSYGNQNDAGMLAYKETAIIMEQLNHSVNFVLYVLACKIFRKRVLSLFRKKSFRTPSNDH